MGGIDMVDMIVRYILMFLGSTILVYIIWSSIKHLIKIELDKRRNVIEYKSFDSVLEHLPIKRLNQYGQCGWIYLYKIPKLTWDDDKKCPANGYEHIFYRITSINKD